MKNKLAIQKRIQEIVDKIITVYNPEKIILFGSYVYGTTTPDSDIDLFIIKETNQRRIDRFVEIKKLIYDPKRKLTVSPLVYTPKEIEERISIGDDFVKEVLEKGKVLYYAG